MRILNFILIAILAWNCGTNDESPKKTCPQVTCGDYLSQQAAQAVYDSDPECYGYLAPNGDDVACASLPSSGSGSGTGTGTGTSGCPTTANCGCSGKKKADCGGSCCTWVVNDGCKCK